MNSRMILSSCGLLTHWRQASLIKNRETSNKGSKALMYISSLILEVTRKCNLRCAHCLRGNPQRVTMPREVLHAAMRDVDYVGSVLFTGGEPSLATEVIEDFIDI